MKRRESVDSLRIESPEESLALLRAALSYSHEDAADIVALNAGAAIYAAGVEGSLVDGVARAQAILRSGDALGKLDALASFTQAQSQA
jgi:anthranilate phosphoribosyltransferase